jgi:hypothetical protein
MFKTGQMIEVTNRNPRLGQVEVETMRVARVINTKKGRVVWFKRTDGTGYGVNVDDTSFTFRIV